MQLTPHIRRTIAAEFPGTANKGLRAKIAQRLERGLRARGIERIVAIHTTSLPKLDQIDQAVAAAQERP